MPDRQRRRRWTPAEDRKLGRLYATMSAAECAQALNRSTSSVQQRVSILGLKKSDDWIAERTRRLWASGRLEGARRTQFRKGNEPANKGRPQHEWMPEESRRRCARTWFREGLHGAARHNWVPIGSQKIRDGQLVRKVTDDPNVYPAARWKPVARIVWEAAHGPVPRGHVVRFKDGMHTTVEAEITLDRLECITCAENMRRNSYHTRFPKEVAQLIQLRGALNRKINNRQRKRDERQERA